MTEHLTDRRDGTASECPDAEQLAAYVDGTLPPEARDAMALHLAGCAECREIAAESALENWESGAPAKGAPVIEVPPRRATRHVPVLTGLAAAAVLFMAVWLWPRQVTVNARVDRLMAMVATEPNRAVEGRLTRYPYAPMPAPVRAGGVAGREPGNRPLTVLSPETQIELAEFERSTQGDRSVEAQTAIAVARLIDGDLDRAIAELEPICATAPSATCLNDLSVAYLARGLRVGRREDVEKARDAAAQAVQLAPSLADAAFNRALAVESLGDTAAALPLWRQAQALDPASPWAPEIAERIRRITAAP